MNGAKVGLAHRKHPYDLNGFQFTTLDTIPSLIPSQLKFGCGYTISEYNNHH